MSIRRVSAHEHDIFIPEVFGNGSFSGIWQFDAFHDIRDDPPVKARGFSGMLNACFNTYNADLVCQARIVERYGRCELRGSLSFDVEHYDVAVEYCRRLREYGRWAYAHTQGYNNGTPIERMKARERRLDVRLVRSRTATIVEEYPS